MVALREFRRCDLVQQASYLLGLCPIVHENKTRLAIRDQVQDGVRDGRPRRIPGYRAKIGYRRDDPDIDVFSPPGVDDRHGSRHETPFPTSVLLFGICRFHLAAEEPGRLVERFCGRR